MNESNAVLMAACLIGARASADQTQTLLSSLSEADRAQVASAGQVLMARLPAVYERLASGPLPGILLPTHQPLAAIQVGLEERRQALHARLTAELGDVEELLQAARRAGEEGAVNTLLDWRSALAARRWRPSSPSGKPRLSRAFCYPAARHAPRARDR